MELAGQLSNLPELVTRVVAQLEPPKAVRTNRSGWPVAQRVARPSRRGLPLGATGGRWLIDAKRARRESSRKYVRHRCVDRCRAFVAHKAHVLRSHHHERLTGRDRLLRAVDV